MPHVITQSCCSDGSCVYACPVNCIHPSPDEPGFATAEMLYIDPVACVDCGACVSACPVGAIAPDTRLEPKQLPFVALNAAFYPDRPAGEKLPPTSKLAPVHRGAEGAPRAAASADGGDRRFRSRRDVRRRRAADPAGGAGQRLRAAAHALRAGAGRRRARPPEHQAGHPAVRQDRQAARLPVLPQRRGRVPTCPTPNCWPTITPCSTPSVRRTIAGSTSTAWSLPGTGTATEMVAWINGHPEYTDLPVDLGHERVVIVGNGNVALDVARILTTDPDALARTDISDHALAALRDSKVTEVVIAARRGPAQSAFTLPELIGLTSTCDVVLDAADHELVLADLAVERIR